MPLPWRKIRIPLVAGALAVGLGIVLLTRDLSALIEDDGQAAPARSDLRIALATAIVLAAIWIALAVVLHAMQTRFDRVERSIIANSDTRPIPRLQVVSASAAVPIAAMVDPDVIDIARRLNNKIRDR